MNQSCVGQNRKEDEWMSKAHTNIMQSRSQAVSHLGVYGREAQTVQVGVSGTHSSQECSSCYVHSPSARSWYSEDGELSLQTSKYYDDLYTINGHANWELYVERDSADLTSSISRTPEARRGPSMTIFPTFMTSTKRPDPEIKRTDADFAQRQPTQIGGEPAKRQSYLAKAPRPCRTATNVYRKGPPGEGQEVWVGSRNYRKEKQAGVVVEMCLSKRTDEAVRMPLPEAIIENQVPDQQLRQPPETTYAPTQNVDQPSARQDSAVSYGEISCTSRDVPIKIRQTDLNLEMDKPLPPTPLLTAVPKSRQRNAQGKTLNLNRYLPQTLFSYSPEISIPCQEVTGESSVDLPWLPPPIQMVNCEPSDTQSEAPWQGSPTHHSQSKHIESKPHATMWLKGQVAKASDTLLHFTSKSSSNKASIKAHATLKAKISRPVLIEPTISMSISKGCTDNIGIAPLCSVHHLPGLPDMVRERGKGKQGIYTCDKPRTWLEKLLHPTVPTMHKDKKRPVSDESFACRGVDGRAMYVNYGYAGRTGLNVQDGGSRVREENGDVDLRHPPLFTRKKHDSSHCNAEGAYTDQRRSDWWVRSCLCSS